MQTTCPFDNIPFDNKVDISQWEAENVKVEDPASGKILIACREGDTWTLIDCNPAIFKNSDWCMKSALILSKDTVAPYNNHGIQLADTVLAIVIPSRKRCSSTKLSQT